MAVEHCDGVGWQGASREDLVLRVDDTRWADLGKYGAVVACDQSEAGCWPRSYSLVLMSMLLRSPAVLIDLLPM